MSSGEGAHARRSARIPGRAVVLALIVVGLLVSAAYPVRSYLAQRSEISALEREARVLEAANRRLGQEIRLLRNPAYIEKVARECHGMVHRGEIAFLVISMRGGTPPPSC